MTHATDLLPRLLDWGQHLSHGTLAFCSTMLLAAWLERALFFGLRHQHSPRPLPAAARGLYGVFAWIGGIAPMAGLLGTVTGIMLSFAGGEADPEHAMRGVGLALSATAVGLLLAMAALSGRAVFGRRTEELEARAARRIA